MYAYVNNVRVLLQYNGAKAPPKHLVFAENVIVQIAGLGNIADVSLHDPQNAAVLELLQEWMKHAKTVYVWKGISKNVMLPFGGHTAQALHIKVRRATVGYKYID